MTGQWETTNTYDPDDRITAEAGPSGSVSHSYDGDGNETTVNGQAASYDWENRLVGLGTAQNPTATASYLYDADGNRVAATTSGTTTDYLVDTTVGFPSVVEERSTSGSLLARYALGDDLIRMDRGSAASYYIFDGLGSTRALTNGSSVTDTYTYDAYGEQVSGTGSTTNAFRFDAQQLDGGTGDYFLRARYYSQSDGRFLSQDPVLGLDIAPISLHRYLYAWDDPANHVDSLGCNPATVGTRVHQVIGEDFVAGRPATRFANYVSVTAILNGLGIPGAFDEGQPDLIETAAPSFGSEGHFVFEIKPFAQTRAGAIQLAGYVGLLNAAFTADGRQPDWKFGQFNDYHYPENIFQSGGDPIILNNVNGDPLPDNQAAVVFPAVDGLILYQSIDKSNQTELATELAYANQMIGEQNAGVQLTSASVPSPVTVGLAISAADLIAEQAQIVTGTANFADAIEASLNLARAYIGFQQSDASTGFAFE